MHAYIHTCSGNVARIVFIKLWIGSGNPLSEVPASDFLTQQDKIQNIGGYCAGYDDLASGSFRFPVRYSVAQSCVTRVFFFSWGLRKFSALCAGVRVDSDSISIVYQQQREASYVLSVQDCFLISRREIP